MGRTIMETAGDFPDICISAALVAEASPFIGQDAGGLAYTAGMEKALTHSDVLVDFSMPDSTSKAIDACMVAHKPIIIGVTGLDAVLKQKIAMASRTIPVLVAPNLSLGAVLLMQLARTAAAALGEDFAVDIKDQ
ncbi:MAG: 4-hydroxy-tetrahydrodipicolinate reductase, partial [Gammaproteobacteria bacterium]|nr:4-hydroxy-tetrahydrodipicolinate reductase [Gammaproteobacteria bacterium]